MNGCDLCGSPLETANGAKAAGMKLCGPCRDGRFEGRLAGRGIRLQSLDRIYHKSGERGIVRTSQIMGAVPCDLGLTANLSPEDWFSKIGKLFKKEMLVGDPEFDSAVYVRTDGPEALAEVLRDEPFRGAVLHAVKVTDSAILIEGGRVTLERHSVPTKEVPRSLLCIALILHYLERLARGARQAKGTLAPEYSGLGPRAYLVPWQPREA